MLFLAMSCMCSCRSSLNLMVDQSFCVCSSYDLSRTSEKRTHMSCCCKLQSPLATVKKLEYGYGHFQGLC